MTPRQATVTETDLGRRLAPLLATLALLAAGLPAVAGEAQEEPAAAEEKSDPWALLRPLVGSWKGAIDGRLGTGEGVRRYELILGGKYLMSRHSSVRLPQEKSPEGDQHEELAVFSFDSERQKIVLREFMIEGVVIRSVCDAEGHTIVCTTEEVESGPGIRARLTLEIPDRYQFVERYEIAWPGKELVHYFTNRWTRRPALDPW